MLWPTKRLLRRSPAERGEDLCIFLHLSDHPEYCEECLFVRLSLLSESPFSAPFLPVVLESKRTADLELEYDAM
jgi:hypothetical protein